MKVSSFQKLNLSSSNIDAYLTKINIFENKKFIFPHEETSEDSQITKDIIKNSVIVLGVTFLSVDTEIIIDNVLRLTKNKNKLKILDIGIGSGCILLSILKEKKNFYGTGIDISKKCINISKLNAINLNLDNRLIIEHE